MTTAIKVNPKLVNPKGDLDYFGEETGTPEFYIVLDILYKHLGKENISVSWDYNDFTYEIKVEKDKNIDYIKIIESIDESMSRFNMIYHENDHLIFEVVSTIATA